ncbi:MAG: LptA/OstA family protein [Acidobacteriota bacterium]
MKFSKWLSLALSLCMAAAGTAIVWSFLSRRQQVVILPKAEMLSPEIARKSTQFEYTEHKEGRPVFQVNAETSTQTVSNVHTLSEVDLAYFDHVEEPSDSITGRSATYRIDEKQLEFNGNTRIRLKDGTEVVSEQAVADMTREVVQINQDFQFKRGEVQGTGGLLAYSFPQREMKISDGFNLSTFSGGRRVQATARDGIYHLSEELIDLLNGAGLSMGDSQLKADRISVQMSDEYQIRSIVSSGQARFQATPERVFSGSRIRMVFDPEDEGLAQVEIFGGPADRATYTQEGGSTPVILKAKKILAVPDNSRIEERLFLKGFAAQDEVSLQLPAVGISQARSDELLADFFEDGDRLKNLHFRGQVSVRQDGFAPETRQMRLRSKTLSLNFFPSENLEGARAERDVELVLSSDVDEKRLVARDFVQVDYDEGVPTRIVIRGDSQVESIRADGRDYLQAPRVDVYYQEGLLERIVAGTGVKVESLQEGAASYTTSDRLEVIYREGLLQQVSQSGRFRFWEGEPATLELQSDEAVFDPATGIIAVTGTEPSLLRTVDSPGNGASSAVETLARSFELDRDQGQVIAKGEVRSTLGGGDHSTLVTAGFMRADRESGWIEYSMDPHIIQGSNSIHGETVKYNHRTQSLVVDTDVTSYFSSDGMSQNGGYAIEADRLVYNRRDLRARYQGRVRLETQDLTLMAPSMDLIFSDSSNDQIQEIVASGGVRIIQQGRTAEGDRAVHHPLEDRVVLTGNPAQVVEAESGRVAGRRLTFYLGAGKILVEGQSASVTP